MTTLFKILGVYLTCTVLFCKAGVPTALVLFKDDFLTYFLVCTAGGVTGNIVFTYLSAVILKKVHEYRAKRHLIHKKPIFTPFNRRVIKIKQRFGLLGIATITPLILSTPLGAFLAERFFKNKRKIILYLSVSVVFWELVFYFAFSLF
ncbi:MAG: hypothetical protein JNK73_07830 [Bacteroidia bacterium]|nr:hypothetical protein [Bacteroidia bacterium]